MRLPIPYIPKYEVSTFFERKERIAKNKPLRKFLKSELSKEKIIWPECIWYS